MCLPDWTYLDEVDKAVGLSEFFVMPSGGDGHVFYYEVISHDNTLNYVMVPEPGSLLFVMAGLAFVPLRMRRR